MDSPLPSSSRRCSSRLSLSKKFSESASKTAPVRRSARNNQQTTSFATAESDDLRQTLTQDPFKLTQLTLAEEDDLISLATDAVTLSSKESIKEETKGLGLLPVISISSGSDREASPTPRKSTISEFFTPVKARRNSPSSGVFASTIKGSTAQKSSSRKENYSKTDPRKVKKVRRQICKSTNIKMLTSKYFDDSQKRITNFFQKNNEDPDKVGYHRVLKSSVMPAINTGDENMERYLHVDIDVGSQPLRTTQIKGPDMKPIPDDPQKIMERIEKAQSALYDKEVEDWNMENTDVPIMVSIPVNEEPLDSGFSDTKTTDQKQTKKPAEKRKSLGAKSTTKKGRPVKTPATTGKRQGRRIVCPKYKIIAGTNFAVDAFRYGDIEGVSHYFLSHFHADHYIGLKRSFAKPLIMSPITSRLVKAFINVEESYYQLIDLHETIVIDNVRITALDANHCPGAVMFLFQLPTGTNILHTGDFRASSEMEEYPEFWNMEIHSIYLDTTYLSSKYAFKSQWESITDACDVVRTILNRNIGARVLIVCGSYLIGKEKVWAELAAQFNYKVWTEPNRRKALVAVDDPLQQQWLVEDPKFADIHVLSMNKLSYDELVSYVEQFPDRYDLLIALRPSGWEKNSRPQYRGRINIVGVEYSEHSSFNELKRFVRYLRPQEVISTVPYGNSNQNKTPQVPPSWYRGDIRPERQALQLSITSFVKVGSKTPVGPGENPSFPKVAPQEDDDDCTIVSSDAPNASKSVQNDGVYKISV
ncbi:DNA cross-link repair 1A protein isoform X2 [Aedes aegypti]|uniref:DNA cross-link repair 1A protein n=1 Tax=Aedes aegypti TaxID=7159 RepID=A0A1S4FTW3_AEDAE|nr:DNA cross-link repair 1A protein isoform X2 [Aedes aegypti]